MCCNWDTSCNVPVDNQIFIRIRKIGVEDADESDAREHF